jgi:plasmid stabilization system protein ParE
MRLLFAPLAQWDLEEISDYIALDKGPRARSFVRELRALCGKIVDDPLAFPERQGAQGAQALSRTRRTIC